jgi:ABC-2 type transport system permease protein
MAAFTPLWGLNQLVHYPLAGGPMDWVWVVNATGSLVVFAACAVWRFRRDTARGRRTP